MSNTTDLIKLISEVVALGGVITTVFVAISKVFAGQRCILRAEMLRIYYHNKNKRSIRQYEYENFVLMYEAYKRLKGNSFIDKIYDEVKTWEVIT